MSSPSPLLLERAQASQAAFRTDPERARELADAVVAQAGPDDGVAKATALLVIVKLHHRETKYGEAVKHGQEALELARANYDADLIANSLNLLGLGQHALANNRTALEHFQEAVRVAESAGYTETAVRAIANTGMVMHALGDLEAALAEYGKLMSNPHVLANDMILAQISHNFGQTSWDLGRDLPACAEAFMLSAEKKRKIGDRWSLTLTLCSLSGVYRDLGKFTESREVLDEIAGFLDVEKSHELSNLYLLNLGVWLMAEDHPGHDLPAARLALEKSVDEARAGGLLEYEIRSREYLTEAMIKSGRHEEACTELKSVASLRQKLQQDESRRQIERLRVAFDVERTQNDARHQRHLRESAEHFNEQIKEQNRHLEKMNREKSDIIGLISHDLRSPLAGAVELTADLVANAHDQKEVIDSGQALLTVQRQMLDLTQTLLDIEALESGSLQSRVSDVDFNTYFNGLIHEHQADISRKNLTITSPATADSLIWTGSKLLLERAVENLFSNAIKYSPIGHRISITWEANPFEIRIGICDTGPGIPPDQRSRIFEKFATLGTPPTGGESTHGLGLYLAQRCAEHAGGCIVYQDTPGGGATFVLTLPKS